MPIALRRLWGIAVVAILFALQSSQQVQAQGEVLLASAGRATMPVVVQENADAQVLEAAGELAEVLGRISGAVFGVETSRDDSVKRGIVVGLASELKNLPFEITFSADAGHPDQYLLRTGDQAVYLLGTTPEAVQCAVWDLLHRLEWNDGSDKTRVVLPAELRLTIRSSLENPMRLGGRWDLYFYVPRGTKVVGGYTDSTRGKLLDAQNQVVFDFGTMEAAGYFSVPVAEGQDRALWKFSDSRGRRMLMTVPPYLATGVENLLLPREVVESDQ